MAPLAQAVTTVNCTVSAGGIAFGIYNPLNAVADASTGTLRSHLHRQRDRVGHRHGQSHVSAPA